MCCRVKIFTHPLDPLPASLMHYIYLFHDNLQWCATGPRRRRYSATSFAFNYLQVFAFKYLQVLSTVLHMDSTLGLKEMFPNKFSLCLRTSLSRSRSHSRSRSRSRSLSLSRALSLSLSDFNISRPTVCSHGSRSKTVTTSHRDMVTT